MVSAFYDGLEYVTPQEFFELVDTSPPASAPEPEPNVIKSREQEMGRAKEVQGRSADQRLLQAIFGERLGDG
jgi:hypothetical protein